MTDSCAPLLVPVPAPISVNIPDLLVGSDDLRQAVAAARQSGTRQAISVELAQVVCVPITVDRVTEGALILAQHRSDGVSAERARGALDLMGFWLSNAVEAHLASPASNELDLDRVSSLCRLLGDSTTGRSDRQLLATFAEALAIWHDLQVSGYVETAGGEFVREVSLAGADPQQSPSTIHRTSLPDSGQIVLISRQDLEHLGFASDQDLAIMRLSGSADAWVVAVCGTIGGGDGQRLNRYLALLDQSVRRCLDASTAHVVASMARHLLDDARPAADQARGALAELQRVLGAPVGLTVSHTAGEPLVQIGPVFGDLDGSAHGIAIVRRLPYGFALRMATRWPVSREASRQERLIVNAVSDLLESWARRLVRESRDPNERRAESLSYGDDLERFASRAVDGGVPVTVVVLSFPDDALRPGLTQLRVGRLRGQMRPTDLVGRLGEGEIGMLLHNTGGESAQVVADRLRMVLQTDDGAEPVRVSIGMASREPGQSPSGALAQQARENAFRHTQESIQ